MKYLKNSFKKATAKNVLNIKAGIIYLLVFLLLIVILVFSIFLLYFAVDDSNHKYYNTPVNNIYNDTMVFKEDTSKLYNFSSWNTSCDWKLIVINSYNELPQDFGVRLGKYKGKEVDYRIIDNLMSMIEDAYKEGLKLWISSAYRDVKIQSKLFLEEVANYKDDGYSNFEAEKMAEKNVARPRKSEHNTGLAIDFNGVRDDFATTKEYEWLLNNAANYGFILRYPEEKKEITGVKFEPWHFRYVGKEAAIQIKQDNICLEEYVDRMIKN